MNLFKVIAQTLKVTNTPKQRIAKKPIHSIAINSLQGKPIDLQSYKGKYMLIVNVASECGFTPQYKQLQQLQDEFHDTLIVIGVPCNQFGKQEPGSPSEIQEFCELNYGVLFPITEKVDVKGAKQHPLFKWLTNRAENGVKSVSVKWNFQKFLIDPEGNFVDYFISTTKPNSYKIKKYLK